VRWLWHCSTKKGNGNLLFGSYEYHGDIIQKRGKANRVPCWAGETGVVEEIISGQIKVL